MSDELLTHWEDWRHGTVQPTARLRYRIYTEKGEVTEFCIQLAANRAIHYPTMTEPAWAIVARFDHNSHPSRGHDVREEGLHLDLFEGTTRESTVYGFPAVALADAPEYCLEYLHSNKDQLLARWEAIVGVPIDSRIYRHETAGSNT